MELRGVSRSKFESGIGDASGVHFSNRLFDGGGASDAFSARRDAGGDGDGTIRVARPPDVDGSLSSVSRVVVVVVSTSDPSSLADVSGAVGSTSHTATAFYRRHRSLWKRRRAPRVFPKNLIV